MNDERNSPATISDTEAQKYSPAMTVALALAALFGPPMVMWACLARGPRHGWLEGASLPLALGIGGVAIGCLPIRPLYRVLLVLLCAPVMFFILLFFGLGYVCNHYGDCL